MTKGVHRAATEHEKSIIPGAFTYNRVSERFHDRNGFPILAPVDVMDQLREKGGRKRRT